MNLTVVDRGGGEHRLSARSGWKLMEVIHQAGLPIKAECGGNCVCATCHVYVDADWAERLPPREPDERATLEFAVEVGPLSRLACQIMMSDALEGLRVTLAPEDD